MLIVSVSFFTAQAVTFELKRLSGIKPAVETSGEASKPKSEDLLPESLAGKVAKIVMYFFLIFRRQLTCYLLLHVVYVLSLFIYVYLMLYVTIAL
jgi:hypothetical protein